MTREQEIQVEIRTLRDIQEQARSLHCGYCRCHDHEGLADRLSDRLRDLNFELKRLRKGRAA